MQVIASEKDRRVQQVTVVGGVADMARDLERRLAAYGISVLRHLDVEHSGSCVVPAGTDAIIVLNEMCSHSLSDKAVEQAKARGLPIASVSRKWALAETQLRRVGIIPKNALPVEPVAQEEEKPVNKEIKQAAQVTKQTPGAQQLPPSIESALRMLVEELKAQDGQSTVTQIAIDLDNFGQASVQYTVVAKTTNALVL